MTFPNDPHTPLDPMHRRPLGDQDSRLQSDPMLHEGRASGSKTAIMALAILAVLGLVFYGMNSGSGPDTASNSAGNVPPATASSERPTTNNRADQPSTPPQSTAGTNANQQQGATSPAAPMGNASTATGRSENTGMTQGATENTGSAPRSPQ